MDIPLFARAREYGDRTAIIATEGIFVQSRLGEEHSDVARSYDYLAGLYLDEGRYSDAEPLCIKALELRQRLLGDVIIKLLGALRSTAIPKDIAYVSQQKD